MKPTSFGQRLFRAWAELTPQGGRVLRAWDAFHGRSRRDAFQGAAVNRLVQDWMAATLSADQELKSSIRRLRARARDLARNEGYGKHFVRLLVTNVIGPTGFKLKSRVRRGQVLDKETNARVEAAWKSWIRSRITVDGKQNFQAAQVLALRTQAIDGEIFVRFFLGRQYPHGLALQLIDPDMLEETMNRGSWDGQNEIRMGVEMDSLGRPVAYHFFEGPRGRSEFVGGTGRIRVPAEEIIHLYQAERPSQTRGVTWLHTSMYPMRMLGGYEEAELVAARTAAAKMGFITSADGVGDEKDNTVPAEFDAAPGILEKLPAGYQFQGWDPQHPVASFPAFIKSFLRKIASGLGVSYNALANDLEGVNYSSLRDGRLSERDGYRMVQEDWIDRFIRPVYATWLRTATLSGALELGSADLAQVEESAVWTARGWQWVDPLKDISAAEKEIGLGVTSRTRICAEWGEDFEEIAEELAAEAELAAEKGISIDGLKNPAAAASAQAMLEMDDEDEDEGEEANGKKNGRQHVPAGRF